MGQLIDTKIKTARIANQVANILAAVEAILVTDGRPRKRPHKARAIATRVDGRPMTKVTRADVWHIDQMSLPGAFQLARIEENSSRKTMLIAMYHFNAMYAFGGSDYPTSMWDFDIEKDTTTIDNRELDTRTIVRECRNARKRVEKKWGETINGMLRKEV